MRCKSHKGFALILVIVVMAVLIILGGAILSISVAEAKFTANNDKRMQAYYLAKSGVDTVTAYIINNPLDAQKLVNAPESLENNHFSNGTFKVDVIDRTSDPSLTTNEIKVKGTGFVGGVQNTSNVIIKALPLSEIIDKAIYTDDNLDITGMKVNGDIQSGGTIQYSTNGSHQYNDTAYPNSPSEIAFVGSFPAPGGTNLTVKNTIEKLTASISYRNINISQNGTLEVVTNGSNIEIAVDNLNIGNELMIDPHLGGSVIIYVNSSMTVTTQGLINNAEAKNLFIYLKSGSKFTIQANMVLNGYIIGTDAAVEIQSSNSTINGAVYSQVVFKNGVGNPVNGTVNYIPLTDAGAGTGSATPTKYKIIRWEK